MIVAEVHVKKTIAINVKYNLENIPGNEFVCDCPSEFSAGIPGVISNYCTDCTLAVIDPYFSTDLKHIYVEFPIPIIINN